MQAFLFLSSLSLTIGLSFQTAELTLNNAPVTITLISRRCTRRLGTIYFEVPLSLLLYICFDYLCNIPEGTRMWRRGANLEGDAANFIETEQLLELKNFKSSFLQVYTSS